MEVARTLALLDLVIAPKSSSRKRTCPLSGVVKAPAKFKSVDLPEPLEPKSATCSPLSRLKSTSVMT